MEDIRIGYKRTEQINVTIPRGMAEDLYGFINTWTNKISGIAVGIGSAAKNTIGSYRVVAIRRNG